MAALAAPHGRHTVSFRRAPPASLLHSHCSLHLHPHCAFHPTASISTRSVVGPKAPGRPAGIRHPRPKTLRGALRARCPAQHCPSVSSIGLSIPNVGWRGTNGRRAQLEMEVEEGGQPCPMTKSNFDPHAPKPTLHLGMPANILDDCARVVNKFGSIICRHLIGSIWRKVFRLN